MLTAPGSVSRSKDRASRRARSWITSFASPFTSVVNIRLCPSERTVVPSGAPSATKPRAPSHRRGARTRVGRCHDGCCAIRALGSRASSIQSGRSSAPLRDVDCGAGSARALYRREREHMSFKLSSRVSYRWFPTVAAAWSAALIVAMISAGAIATMQSAAFELKVLKSALPEAPFGLRFFSGAVKTDSRGEIITGPDDDPVKNLVGAESAGERAGLRTLHEDHVRRRLLRRPPRPGHAHRPEQSRGEQRQASTGPSSSSRSAAGRTRSR